MNWLKIVRWGLLGGWTRTGCASIERLLQNQSRKREIYEFTRDVAAAQLKKIHGAIQHWLGTGMGFDQDEIYDSLIGVLHTNKPRIGRKTYERLISMSQSAIYTPKEALDVVPKLNAALQPIRQLRRLCNKSHNEAQPREIAGLLLSASQKLRKVSPDDPPNTASLSPG